MTRSWMIRRELLDHGWLARFRRVGELALIAMPETCLNTRSMVPRASAGQQPHRVGDGTTAQACEVPLSLAGSQRPDRSHSITCHALVRPTMIDSDAGRRPAQVEARREIGGMRARPPCGKHRCTIGPAWRP